MSELPTSYIGSDQKEVLISSMPYTRLVNSINVRSRESGGASTPLLEALRAELARRPPPSLPEQQAERHRMPTGAEAAARGEAPAAASQPLPPRHEIGANDPPAEDYAEILAQQNEHLLSQAAELESAAALLPREVETEEHMGEITAWVVKAQNLTRAAEKVRKETKEPHLVKGRAVDTFFGSIAAMANTRIASVEKRKIPYLQARRAAEEAERSRQAAILRQSQQEALQRENEEREATNLAAAAVDTAKEKLRNATTEEEIAAAETELRAAAKIAQLSGDAAEQAVKDAKAAGKVADRQERIIAGDHRLVLGKVSAGGGSSTLRVSWKPDVHNAARLTASLGPLAPFLGDAAIDAALQRAAKADTRPAIPGVDFIEDLQARTTAARS